MTRLMKLICPGNAFLFLLFIFIFFIFIFFLNLTQNIFSTIADQHYNRAYTSKLKCATYVLPCMVLTKGTHNGNDKVLIVMIVFALFNKYRTRMS